MNSHWKLFLHVIISFAIAHDEIIGYGPSINTAPVRKGESLQHELTTGTFDDRVHLRLQTKASNAKLVTNFKNHKELAVAIFNIYINESAGVDIRKSPTGMLSDWGFCRMLTILPSSRISMFQKPSELPELSATTPNMPEYSDSKDEKFFNPQEHAPALSSLIVSLGIDSEVPIEVADLDADAVYQDFNPWYASLMEGDLSRTGAASFIAIELLFRVDGISPQHSLKHDLESFFYAIIVILMLFIEPGVKRTLSTGRTLDWNIGGTHTTGTLWRNRSTAL
ncbi:hypothetical protein DFH29DRAFT_884353 [Suillus ampliporus]|nr:hypothetical protein DFH29DRAFT_884353 [Suillus ampliporus]